MTSDYSTVDYSNVDYSNVDYFTVDYSNVNHQITIHTTTGSDNDENPSYTEATGVIHRPVHYNGEDTTNSVVLVHDSNEVWDYGINI